MSSEGFDVTGLIVGVGTTMIAILLCGALERHRPDFLTRRPFRNFVRKILGMKPKNDDEEKLSSPPQPLGTFSNPIYLTSDEARALFAQTYPPRAPGSQAQRPQSREPQDRQLQTRPTSLSLLGGGTV